MELYEKLCSVSRNNVLEDLGGCIKKTNKADTAVFNMTSKCFWTGETNKRMTESKNHSILKMQVSFL